MNPITEFDNPLVALSTISESINTLHDIDEVLKKILDIALRTVNAQRGVILMSEHDDPAELKVRLAHNLDSNSISALAPFSRSIVETAMASGETLITYNPEGDERFTASTSIANQKIVAAACLPLRIKTRRLGAIYMDSTETRGKFRPEMEPFLNAFAHQAAIGTEHQRRRQRRVGLANERFGFGSGQVQEISPA